MSQTFFYHEEEYEIWKEYYMIITGINYELKDVFENILEQYGDCPKCGSDTFDGINIIEVDGDSEDEYPHHKCICCNCGYAEKY